ncbi:hypothetical protein E1189_03720 [Sansalvadorimonas verongulae]|nr:hypothetical protein [Sansalvadorimonas verongulae]
MDNNLPPQLARAIEELCRPYKNIEVWPLCDLFDANTPDIDWITDLSSEKAWVIISQDRFAKGSAEKQALRESGLTVFFLDKQWAKQKYWDKSHNLVRWWPAIMEQADRMTGGSAFRVRWRFGGKAQFEQVKV